MNIRDLEYLIAVSKHKSFVKASLECHVSQPTLSGQIRKLEGYLGAQIFERTTKQVTVTSFGKEIININPSETNKSTQSFLIIK